MADSQEKEYDGAGDALNHPHFTPDDAKSHRWWLCYGRTDADGKFFEQEWEWFKNADAVTDFIDKLEREVMAIKATGELMGGIWVTVRVHCPEPHNQPESQAGWVGVLGQTLPKNRQHAYIQRMMGRFLQDVLKWRKSDFDAMKPKAEKVVARGQASAGLAKKRGVADVAAATKKSAPAKATPVKRTTTKRQTTDVSTLTGKDRSDAVSAAQESGGRITASRSKAAKAAKNGGNGSGVSAGLARFHEGSGIKPKSQTAKRTPARGGQSTASATIVPRSQVAKEQRAAKRQSK